MHYFLAIVVATVLYLLQNYYYSKHWNQHLTAKVSYNKKHARIGETIILTEQITNNKRLPLPVLHVKFSTSRTFLFEDSNNASVSDYYHRNDIFSIMGNQQITRTLQFRTTRRGYYATDSINLIATDLFLRGAFAAKLENHTALYVYPMLLHDRQSLAITNSVLGDIEREDLYEDPLSFRSIRDYTNGDSMRYINWKATAKTQQLMVNTYFDNQSTKVVLLLNLDTNMMHRDNRLQEYMISVTATLLHHMQLRGLTTRVAINLPDPFTDEIAITDYGTGEEHLHSLFQLLARLNLSKKTTRFEDFFEYSFSLFDKTDNSTSYLIISNYRKESLLAQYSNKRTDGYKIQFVCPEFPSECTPIPNVQYWEVGQHEI